MTVWIQFLEYMVKCNKSQTYSASSQSIYTAWKVSKYGVFSGPFFYAFGLNVDQKKLRIWTLFTQCKCLTTISR